MLENNGGFSVGGELPHDSSQIDKLAAHQNPVRVQDAQMPMATMPLIPSQIAVQESFAEANKRWSDAIQKQLNDSGETSDIPVEHLAIYHRWRNGELAIDDSNRSAVFSALTSVATNGSVQDDVDARSFMTFAKRTNDETHELKPGLDIESDAADQAHIQWSPKAIEAEFKNHFDAMDAGEAGMQLFTNERLKRMAAGLKEGENYFDLPHNRQMEIVRNLTPLYKSDRWGVEVEGMMKSLGSEPVECSATDAGKYLLDSILKGKASDVVDQENIGAFLASGEPRTEDALARWLISHPLDAGFTGNADVDAGIATMNAGKDWVFGYIGEDGKAHVKYQPGQRVDRDFALKGKVIDDIADADGRYSAIRAISVLNKHPQAWSFVKRWADKFMSPAESKPVEFDSMGMPVYHKQIGETAGDVRGTFDMMMDYLNVADKNDKEAYNSRWADIQAACTAISCIDRRAGAFWSDNWGKSGVENAAGRAITGAINAIDGGFVDFWKGITKKVIGWFGDDGDYAADWASKHVPNDSAEAETVARGLMSELTMLNESTAFDDRTVVGGAAEFFASIEAMGPLFGASSKAVGSVVGKTGELAMRGGHALKMANRARWIGDVLQKSGAFGARVGFSIARPGEVLSASAKKARASLKEIERLRKVAGPGASEAVIKEADAAIAKLPANPEQLTSFSDSVAQFLSKIPAAGVFYDDAERHAMGGYMLGLKTPDAKEIEEFENWAKGKGAISGLMMAGIVHLADANKARFLMSNASLGREVSALEKRFEAILNGSTIPASDDAARGLVARLVMTRAFAQAEKAFADNAKFVFTMEEANNIIDNAKTVADRKKADPNYKPTIYDYVQGQSNVLAETAKIASTAAVGALVTSGARQVIAGGNLPEGARQAIADSRLRLLENQLGKVDNDSGKAMAKKVVMAYDAAKTRKDKDEVREEIRKRYGEGAARLFDQVIFEVNRPRTATNTKIATNVPLFRRQEVTADGIRKTLSSLGATGVAVDEMPNGFVRLGITAGSEIGGRKFDTDKTLLVRTSDMKGLNRGKDGKFDLNWVNEVVTKHLDGDNHFGKFGEKYDALTKSQKARVLKGEDVKGVLSEAERNSNDAGLFIPKDDYRFGKLSNANLADGIIVLANADRFGRTPMKGLEKIQELAGSGADAETFLHEYFHAITDLLPFSDAEKAEMQEVFGKAADGTPRNWKEGFVDNFLAWYRNEDGTARKSYYDKMNERGLFRKVIDSAKALAGGTNIWSDEKMRESESVPTLDEYLGEIFKAAKDDATKRQEADALRQGKDSLVDEILKPEAGSFAVKGADRDTRGVLEGFRSNIVKVGEYGATPKHDEWVRNIAQMWYDGRLDMRRYPQFDGFADGDLTLARSLVVASLHSMNDATVMSDTTSARQLMKRAGYSDEGAAMLLQSGTAHKGMKGYDPTDCVPTTGGYVKLSPEAMDSVRHEVLARQTEAITEWAKQNKCWYKNLEDYAEKSRHAKNLEKFNGQFFGQGSESVVLRDARRGKIVKHIGRLDLTSGSDADILLDRIVLFNQIFPEARMTLRGWCKSPHTDVMTGKPIESFGAIVEQPYVVGEANVTPAEVENMMKAKGFTKFYDGDMKQDAYVSKDGSVVVRDINANNALRMNDGSIVVIDAMAALNTKHNVETGVVPDELTSEGKFKPGTYSALWDVTSGEGGLLDANDVDANWNVIGDEAFASLLGKDRAPKVSILIRDSYRDALKAINDENIRENGARRKRIDNPEINEWLSSRGRNELTIETDGGELPIRFFRGGADNRTRYEYAGSSAVIPRNFTRKVASGEDITISEFFKKDPYLFKQFYEDMGNTSVLVMGSPKYDKYAQEHRNAEFEKTKEREGYRAKGVEPIFSSGVGVNEFGDIIIETKNGRLPDNRTISRGLNEAIVKLTQAREHWDTPVTYSKEYFTEVLSKRRADSDLSFVMGDAKLKDIILDVVNQRLDDIEVGRSIMGLGTDREQIRRRVVDAISETIRSSAKYFAADIEARKMGLKFGKELGDISEYSKEQEELVNALVKPYERNGIDWQDQSRRTLEFYKSVVMNAVNKAVFGVENNNTSKERFRMNLDFAVALKDYIRSVVRESVENVGRDAASANFRDSVFGAKDYTGRVRGQGGTAVAAERGNVAESVEKKLDEGAAKGTEAYQMVFDKAKEIGSDKSELARILNPEGEFFKRFFDLYVKNNVADADLYSKDELLRKAKNLCVTAVADSFRESLALHNVSDPTGGLLAGVNGALIDINRSLKRENKALTKRVERLSASRIKAQRIRNAAGMSMEEVNQYFGNRDIIREIARAGEDENSPVLDAVKLSNELTTDFIMAYRDRNPDAASMPISELLNDPIMAAEYTATVAQFLKNAAKTLAFDSRRFGRVREAIMRDVATLRHYVRPSMETAKKVLAGDVERITELQSLCKRDTVVKSIEKIIDKKALGSKPVVQNQKAYDRIVHPRVQAYWKEVKGVMGLHLEDRQQEMADGTKRTIKGVQTMIAELDAKWNFTGDAAHIGMIGGEGSEGIEEMTPDRILDRDKALLKFIALNRYGALKFRPMGELVDKVEEVANDILTHRQNFIERFSERNERDEATNKALVDALTRNRGQVNGSSLIELSKSRKFWRSALYHSVPDLFLRMKMMFPKGSEAYEAVESFRRDMSLAHIGQESAIAQNETLFSNKVEEIYGRKFDDVVNDLLTPDVALSKFSRMDWGIPNGKHHAVIGGDPNNVRSKDGMSIGQLIYVYAACNQADMKRNNEVWGRDAEYFREVAEVIGEEGLALAKWMRDQFEVMRQSVSPIAERMTGLPVLSPGEEYFPLHFMHSQRDPLERDYRYSTDYFPTFLIKRVNHDLTQLDERRDVFHVFTEKMHDTAHYVNFMPIIDRVKTTFASTDVQTAYEKTLGHEAYNEMYKQLSVALRGGRMDKIHWLSGIRNMTTAGTLFYNIPSAIKQFEGVAGWSAEMGVLHWFKDMVAFRHHCTDAVNRLDNLDTLIEVRKREGFSDVSQSLKDSIDAIDHGGALFSAYRKYKKHGLTLTSLIDRCASRSMAGAFYNQKVREYRLKGDTIEEANRKALADTDYAIQTTQQSSRPEFQIAAQRNEYGKLLAQFAGPAYVRLGIELEALHRYVMTKGDGTASKADIKAARREFFSKAIALHVICPTVLTMMEAVSKVLTAPPDEDADEIVAASLKAWGRNVLTGPFSGMFVFGSLIESGANRLMYGERSRYGAGSIPMASKLYGICDKTATLVSDMFKSMTSDDVDMGDITRRFFDAVEALCPAVKHGEHLIERIAD